VVASGRRRVQEKRLTPLEGLVPILAPAGALHTLLEGGRSVSDALGRYWESLDVEGCGALFQRLIEERSALVLVDGLDEVPDAAGRVTLARKLGDFTRRHPGVRVIVTSRRVGFDALVLGAWEPFEVAPFGPDQIRALAERWFVECEKARTIETPDVVRRGGRNAEEFLRAVEGHPRLKDLLRNPLLLTLACLVQRQGGRLPRYRVELYDLIGQTLIETWDAVRSLDARPVGPVGRDYRKEARDVLWPLARSLHGRAGGDVVSEGELVELLAERLRAGAVSAPEAAGAAHRFIEELRKATHLLLERGPGQWAFMHPTFQEFFCAQSIAAAESPVEEILPHVYDPRWREVIRLVAGVLGVLHGRAPAVTRLVRAILDSDDPLRGRILRHNLWLAADCLTDAGGAEPDTVHEVVEELTAVALDPQGGGYFRDRAAKRVGALFEVTGVARVEPFLEATKSRDAPVRATAVTVLGAMRRADPDLIRLLLGMLGDADWGVRSAAADALAAIAPTKPAAVQALLDRLGDADPLVASGAAEALGSLGSAEPRVIQALMDGLAAEVWLVRSASARALGRVGRAQPGVVQALLRSLDDKEAPVRSAAAAALGRLGASDPNVVQALMARIEDTDPLVILEAAEALTVMRAGQPDAVQALLRRLEDKSLLVRWAATRALGCVGAGDPRAVEALLGRLHDEHWRVCLAAARALGASSPGVLGAILELLEHQEWEVRWAAAEALGELGATEPGVIQGLLQRLGDAHPWVGLSAAEALGELGAAAHRVVQALLSALTDEAQGVRSAAAGALDRIAALNPDLQLPAPDAGDQPGS
jgi:HEAT repeat protein